MSAVDGEKYEYPAVRAMDGSQLKQVTERDAVDEETLEVVKEPIASWLHLVGWSLGLKLV